MSGGSAAPAARLEWQTHRWSLRFREQSSEHAFVASRSQQLRRVGLVARCVITLAIVAVAALRVEADTTFTLASRVTDVVFQILFFALERSKYLREDISAEGLELYWAVQLVLFSLGRLISNDQIGARAFASLSLGQADIPAPADFYMYGGFVLTMVSPILCTQLFPIRSYLFAMPAGTTFICFMVGAISFSSQVELGKAALPIAVHSVLFVPIVAVSLYAARTNERCQRDLFMNIVVEKTLRFNVEHRVDEATPPPSNENQEDCAVSSARTRSTTMTGHLFRDPTASGSMDAIAALGADEHWLIDADEIRPVQHTRVLGCGGFGFVIPALYHGADIALKACLAKGDCRAMLASVAHELRLLRHLRHPNLVAFVGACIDEAAGELVLVLERVDGLALQHVARRPRTEVGMGARLELACGVASALSYLHARKPPLVHGDIKGSNILVESGPRRRLRAKLLDFGLSRLLRPGAKRLGGTLGWMAPEVVRGRGAPHPSTDIYSFGWVVMMSMTGLHPASIPAAVRSSIQAADIVAVQNFFMEDAAIGEDLTRLVVWCCLDAPHERPRISEVLTVLTTMRGALPDTSSGDMALDVALPQALQEVREWIAASRQAQQAQQLAPVPEEGAAPPPMRAQL